MKFPLIALLASAISVEATEVPLGSQSAEVIAISSAVCVCGEEIPGVEKVFDTDVLTCFEASAATVQFLELEFVVAHVSQILTWEASTTSVVEICDDNDACSECPGSMPGVFDCGAKLGSKARLYAESSEAYNVCEVGIIGKEAESEVAEVLLDEIASAILPENASDAQIEAGTKFLSQVLSLLGRIGDECAEGIEKLLPFAVQVSNLRINLETTLGDAVEVPAAEDMADWMVIWGTSKQAATAVNGNSGSCGSLPGSRAEFRLLLAAVERVVITRGGGGGGAASVQVCSGGSCEECAIGELDGEFACNNATGDRIIVSGVSELCEVKAYGVAVINMKIESLFEHLGAPQETLDKIGAAIAKLDEVIERSNEAADVMVAQVSELRRKVDLFSSMLGGPKTEFPRLAIEPDKALKQAFSEFSATGLDEDVKAAFGATIQYIVLVGSKLVYALGALAETEKLASFVSGVLYCRNDALDGE